MSAPLKETQDSKLTDQQKSEDWKLPDGRQLTWQALQAMGCTSGDVGEIMRQFYRDPDPGAFQNFSLKGGMVMKDQKVGSENESIFDERRREQAQLDEDKKLQDKLAEERRPQEEAANNRIMGLPLGLASFGLGLGLTSGALSAVGGRIGGLTDAANNPMMIASNNGGGMVKALRNLSGMEGPGADKDILLKGPNQTATFTPGEPEPAPEMSAEGPMASAPGLSRKPGLSAPSFGPPGMA